MIRRAWTVAAAVALALLSAASAAPAHDFWLVPDAFSARPGGRITARGQTSSLFPTSLSAVTPDRIVQAKVLTPGHDVVVGGAAVSGTSLLLDYRPTAAGQHVIGVQLAPRSVRESPASFRRYLDLEGAPEARERYEREGLLAPVGSDSLTRRYAKYAKTFVEVGRGRRAYQRVVGHPLEIVPLTDPAALRAGDTLRVRLVLLGKPVASARLHAGAVPQGGRARTDTAAARRAAAADVALATDTLGVATLVVGRAGLWNVRTIQIVPAAKASGADWDVHWATMVFPVASRPR